MYLLRDVDCAVSKLCGKRACMEKIKFNTYNRATYHEQKHNGHQDSYHKVRAYYCGHCGFFHLGKLLPKDAVRTLLTRLSNDEQEVLIPIFEEHYPNIQGPNFIR